MLTMYRFLASLFLCLVFAGPIAAQTPSLAAPSLNVNDGRSISVVVTNWKDLGTAVILDKNRWVVIVRTPTLPTGVQVPIDRVEEQQFFTTTGGIRIIFVAAVSLDATEADVICLIGKTATVRWAPKKAAGKLGFFAVDKRDKADVFLFGSWTNSLDRAPAYNLDLSVGAPLYDVDLGNGNVPSLWRTSASASVKSSDHRTIDPDSYMVTGKFGRLYPVALGESGKTYLDFQWDVARFEFSRKDEFANFLTAPTVVLAQSLARSLTDQKMVRAAIDAELSAGVEVGHNTKNKGIPEGYGGILRFVPGIAVYASFPGALGLEEIRWTTTYKSRLLGKSEPFTDLRDDENAVSSLGKGTRHEWKDTLDFKVRPLFGLTFTHEYGSTPPAFKILDHRFSLGATVMWAWKK